MTKAKVGARAPVTEAPEEAEVEWGRRAVVPLLVMAILISAVAGSGLLVGKFLERPIPSALAKCQATSVQIGPRDYLGPQPMCITASQQFDATINTTQGPVVIRLHPEVAPVTVNNFIVLALHGYYDGLTFWKSEDWVVQSGDPQNNGSGGPGYSLPDEPSQTPWGLAAMGMARVPGGSVNGGQFFIQKAAWPGSGPTAVYNRFGTVTSGMGFVQLLTSSDTITSISIKAF